MSASILDGPRVDGRRRARLRDPEPDGRIGLPVAAVAILPIVVAGVRAAASHWLAVGDNANVLVRSRDVLTSNHPLIGLWSSASIAIGRNVNHPGPLLFDVLALPAKLFADAGVALGMAAINAVCVAVAVFYGRRTGGARGAAVVGMSSAALAWTMGSSLLHDPWNPHAVIFPVLLTIVLAWAMACGDTSALPVAVAVVSFVVQTHGSEIVVAPAIAAVGALLLLHRRRRTLARAALVALAVLALCWVQPVLDQIGGDGNVGALAYGLVHSATTNVGVARGTQMTADVLSIPPFWLRPSFDDAMRYPPGQPRFLGKEPNIAGLPSTGAAALSLVALVGVLGLAFTRARRRGDDALAVALGLCGAALLIALVSTIQQPVGVAGLSSHLQRYLWPIGTFTTALLVVTFVPRRWSIAAPVAGAVVLAVLALPAHEVQASGPASDHAVIPVMRDIASQLRRVDLPDPLLVNTRTRYAEPWTSPLIATLQSRGIDVRVDDDGWARQLGDGRRDHGEATTKLWFAEGPAADVVPDGARRVAHHDPLTQSEHRELARLERTLLDLHVELNDAGRAAVAVHGLAAYDEGKQPTTESLLADGTLAELVRLHLVDVPTSREHDVARYASLRTRVERQTLSVFVGPR